MPPIKVYPPAKRVFIHGGETWADIRQAIMEVTGKKQVLITEWTIYHVSELEPEPSTVEHYASYQPTVVDLDDVEEPIGRRRIGFRQQHKQPNVP